MKHREEFWLENAECLAYHEDCFHDVLTRRRKTELTHTHFFRGGKASYGRNDTAETAVAPGGIQEPINKSEQRAEWLAKAMLLVRDHPEWPDAEIARQVGKDKSTLSRCPEYQAAAALARGDKGDRHRGHITIDPNTGLRDVEAYSDDPADRDWDE